MFWSQVLRGNKITTVKSKKTRVLHISSAVLVKHGNSDKVFVQLSDDKMRIIIAAFLVNKNEYINLNLNILLHKDKEYNLTLLSGENAEVHISGYYQLHNIEEKSKKEHSIMLKERAQYSDKVERCYSEDKHLLNTSCEEIDEGVNNEELEKFLNRKTKGEFDQPQKLEKLPKQQRLQRPRIHKKLAEKLV